MKKVFLLLVLSIITYTTNAVPKRMAQCDIGLPKELNTALIKETTAEKVLKNIKANAKMSSTKRFWDAYSDRINNNTYEAPTLNSAIYTQLDFNQPVRIAKIQNGFAYVYYEPNKEIEYPMISSDAKFYGWIPIDNLLIWSSCITTDDGIYNKALLCVNLNEFSNSTQSNKDETEFGSGFFSPTDKNQKVQLATDMNFYFIMKRSNGMVLLARQTRLDIAKYSKEVLFAWVPDVSYVPWNQRSCLEPTWNFEDAEYFANAKHDINIYKNNQLGSGGDDRIAHIEFKKRTPKTERDKQYIYRMPGNALRFPILDETTDKVYNISTFSMIGDDRAINALSEKTESDQILEDVLKKMQNINLAIVIDGTSSMAPYYPAVKDAIKQGCQYFGSEDKIKVGIVIYRDYADGNGLKEVMPFTSVRNIERINDFLESGGKYGIRSSKADRTNSEALFYGINTALDSLRFREGEGNMMLVVGDCGNAPNDSRVSKDDIIKKLVDKKISIMGFQVQNKHDDDYYAFNDQMLEIIRLSLKEQYSKLGKDDGLDIVVKAKSLNNGYDYTANTSNNFYFGSYRCAIVGENDGKMAPETLTSLMSNTVLNFAETIKTRRDVIYRSNMGFAYSKNTDPGVIDIDKAYVISEMGKDNYSAIEEKGNILNFRGYTQKTIDGRDAFKSVIFLSRDEFQHLLKQMSGVYNAAKAQNYDDREPFIKAMKAMVRSFLPGITENDINNMNNRDITKLIGGLHESANMLKGDYTIETLSETQAVPRKKYMGILQDFKLSYENLNHIFQSNTYKYIKDFNGVKYYWIPIEDLP